MSILRSLGGSQQGGGGTTNQVAPATTPSYYQWSMRQTNMSNFGGVENYIRG